MNYIAEINGFERWLETHQLPASTQLLWYKLLYWSSRAGWQEWTQVDNRRLMVSMQITREASLIENRDRLVNAGLLEYQRGKKGKPGRYRLISLLENTTKYTYNLKVQNEVQSEVYPVVYPVVQNEVQSVDIYKQKQKEKQNKKGGTEVPPEKTDVFLPEAVVADKTPVENRQAEYAAVRDLYHTICHSYPRVTVLSEKRKKAISARIRTGYTLDDFKRTFELAESSDFLKGKNKKNWSADFDWMIADSNMAKILDGKYKNRENEGGEPDASGGSTEDFYRRYLEGCSS